MKKLLIVIPSLHCGGAEKELVTMLGLLDHTKWQIDLFLFEDIGMFRGLVPNEVQIIPRDDLITAWNLPLRSSISKLLSERKWKAALSRIAFKFELLWAKHLPKRSRIIWNYYRKLLPSLTDHYDVAVGYLEGFANYYVAERVKANRKIGTVHSDYEKLTYLDRKMDRQCFEILDAVRIDSECSRQSLAREFPDLEHKFQVAECPVSPSLIITMAALEPDPYGDGFRGIRILTVGRLSHPKGIDFAVKACAILKAQNHPVRWYIVGEGEDRPALTQLIASHGLQQDFILLGMKLNPYPFMATCDICVQPSRWEGWSITVEEYKVLEKPMVLTAPAAGDRIENMTNGIVVDADESAIAEGIIKLIDDPGLRTIFQQNLNIQGSAGENNVRIFNRILDPTSNQ